MIAASTAPVTAGLLESISADPEWLARVLIAAGCALNSIAYADSIEGIKDRAVSPEGTVTAVRSILRDAFTDWGAITAALDADRQEARRRP